jgi:hypothetical protein
MQLQKNEHPVSAERNGSSAKDIAEAAPPRAKNSRNLVFEKIRLLYRKCSMQVSKFRWALSCSALHFNFKRPQNTATYKITAHSERGSMASSAFPTPYADSRSSTQVASKTTTVPCYIWWASSPSPHLQSAELGTSPGIAPSGATPSGHPGTWLYTPAQL